MAQRFGGKYSPGGRAPDAPLQHAKRSRVGGRLNLLFFAPLFLVIKAFSSEPVVMATHLGALGSFLLGAWLTREGLLAQDAFEARAIARRPAIPRKIFGAVMTGVGLGLTGLAGHGPIDAVVFAALGVILHLLAFGLDPLRSKGIEGVDDFQTQRVVKAVEQAEQSLQILTATIRGLNDRNLLERIEGFAGTVRTMLRAIEADPRDLTAARKYLSVYLRAACEASEKFADLYQRRGNAKTRDDYVKLIEDLDQNFARKTQVFLADDHIDLDIEIGVLRDRLKSEGVALHLNEREN
jgi:hypothetical protein